MELFALGCLKSPVDKKDYLITNLVLDIMDKLPSEIDYTNQMTPPRNQGNEGSCVGFATVAVREYQEKIDWAYILPPDGYVKLSPRYVYELAKKISGTSEGTTLKAAAQVCVKNGICQERYWRYIPKQVGKPEEDADKNAAYYKIEPGYVRITNEKELKAGLAKFGALLIAVKVYKNWYRDNKTGYIPDSTWMEKLQGALGGHAICLVGYNDTTQKYKFKNSWQYSSGKWWGENGYGYLSYKELKFEFMEAIQMVDIRTNLPKEISISTIADMGLINRFKAHLLI